MTAFTEMPEATDPLDRFWLAFTAPDPLFSGQETVWWPPGQLDALVALKLLVPTTSAAQFTCISCSQRHDEPVETLRRPDGTTRRYIWCPETGRVDIDDDRLRQWRPDFMLLARRVKEHMGINGRVSMHIPDRLWRIGTMRWKSQPREVYLARGLGWEDGDSVARRIPTDERPIVCVGQSTSVPPTFEAARPVVVPLATIMRIDNGKLTFDTALLFTWIANADAAAAVAGAIATAELQRRIDRIAEKRYADGGKCDVIKALDSQGQSCREIAEELTKRQMPLHASNVARRKKRLVGGRPPSSSGSIVRDAVSQPRDKKGRAIGDAQPKQEE